MRELVCEEERTLNGRGRLREMKKDEMEERRLKEIKREREGGESERESE